MVNTNALCPVDGQNNHRLVVCLSSSSSWLPGTRNMPRSHHHHHHHRHRHCHPPPSPGCRAPETHQWVKGSRGPLSLFLRVNMQIIRANTQQGERLLRKLLPPTLRVAIAPLAGPTHPHPSNLGTAPFSRQRDLKALPYSSNVSHFNNRKRTIGHKMLIGHTFANLALTHDWVGLACGKEKSI